MILTKVKNEVGATAIEYGLIASLISVLAVSGMSAVGVNLSNTYCTISKHLGGSGTCSGGGPSGAGGNGGNGGSGSSTNDTNSNGLSTDSVNSTNSYAEGATMDQVNKSLKDPLDLTYVPNVYGGKDHYYGQSFGYQNNNAVPTFSEYLKNINATDPITNVFGTYSFDENQSPMTDYNTVQANLKSGGSNILIGSNGDQHSIEVTTASGKVYTLHANSDGSVTQKEESAPVTQ